MLGAFPYSAAFTCPSLTRPDVHQPAKPSRALSAVRLAGKPEGGYSPCTGPCFTSERLGPVTVSLPRRPVWNVAGCACRCLTTPTGGIQAAVADGDYSQGSITGNCQRVRTWPEWSALSVLGSPRPAAGARRCAR